MYTISEFFIKVKVKHSKAVILSLSKLIIESKTFFTEVVNFGMLLAVLLNKNTTKYLRKGDQNTTNFWSKDDQNTTSQAQKKRPR